MTAHELARQLLAGPDLPVMSVASGGDEYGFDYPTPLEQAIVECDSFSLNHCYIAVDPKDYPGQTLQKAILL